jgi:hypothetical protein
VNHFNIRHTAYRYNGHLPATRSEISIERIVGSAIDIVVGFEGLLDISAKHMCNAYQSTHEQ